ncbi:MAG: sigma-54 dependent transcriptional regulator [Desulfarculaceae bacterium]|nr:sigma-54 dependent transcriptional regulator [Desulfarculaceae bacterium]MCF8072152.1 sigma-54 dependent transcriptional regulator [Desulfarculaceae bacterium]MCF8100073.1 sigma-54 dependent transcriptional regulator [Desulfarculaceae bacterium]MCF8118500.1 sigma-54 dependent transcriptional regulator [Desulfarculaceae bacterium]
MAPDSPTPHNPAPTGRIMVVDDEGTALKNLRRILEKEGHQVSTYSNPVRALELLKREAFDVLLSDLRMPHMDGLELLDQAKLIDPGLEVVIITGYASLNGAVEATKKGAYHFLAKPFTPDQVRAVVAEALALKLSRDQAHALEQEQSQEQGPLIIGQSPQMRRVAEVVAQIAPTGCNVLIMGESGTGKELAARAIHAQSQCAGGPFVAFNCAALNAELMENELFGHEKGAYTGAGEAKAGLLEAAQGGTIFLDEIGEMPQAMQVKLLRALQEREVLRVGGTEPIGLQLRVVAATARDLKAEVGLGAFRQDLYYRLNVVSLQLPRLAERGDDIQLLAYFFLGMFNQRMHKEIRGLGGRALDLLNSYAYPGNVRELANIMERAVALCGQDMITERDLPPDLAAVELASFSRPGGEEPTLEELERRYIEHILEITGGVRTRAAAILGIDRVSLWRKMKKFSLE